MGILSIAPRLRVLIISCIKWFSWFWVFRDRLHVWLCYSWFHKMISLLPLFSLHSFLLDSFLLGLKQLFLTLFLFLSPSLLFLFLLFFPKLLFFFLFFLFPFFLFPLWSLLIFLQSLESLLFHFSKPLFFLSPDSLSTSLFVSLLFFLLIKLMKCRIFLRWSQT